MYGHVAHDLNAKSRSEDVQVVEDVEFPSLLLPNFILRGLERAGFKKPSPIQLSAIPLARCGLDLIVQAKSGTGKTLVFGVTTLEFVKVKLKRLQVVILAPTREIALQNADVIQAIGHFLKGLKIATFIGGTPIENDKRVLSKCHVAVGAPGRIRHLIEQGLMDSSAVRLLVLDEADKLMEEVFLNDINYIFQKCCSSKQTIACSATYTPELLAFVNQFMKSGHHVIPEGSAVPVLLGLRQFVQVVSDHANTYARLKLKQEALFNLLTTVRFDQALIFTNYITRAESLCSMLTNKGWGAACLTGKQAQELRNETVKRLKEHKARIVVATDIASRGLDASSINLVINMDVPLSGATYLHRMGRAGRFGSQGVCITIVSEGQDCKRFTNILGEIGGTSMNVNILSTAVKTDLWTVNMDHLPKVYGTIQIDEKEQTPKDESGNQESNSSDSDTGSVNASNEGETPLSELISKQNYKKPTKIGNRIRKFSNSLREQIEGSESSDYAERNVIDLLESKQLLPFLSSKNNSNSSTSQNSYKSSENDNEEDILFSSNVASSETYSTECDVDNICLMKNKCLNSFTGSFKNIDSWKRHSYTLPYCNSYYEIYKYYSNNNSTAQFHEHDWYIRIQRQIQNFVKYSHNFRPL